ncbi:flagellar biosynthesis protein FlgB [Kineosporia sp. NBRC 101731]|uniref:flagellar basal body rod protein FlgB n=1 Tax=Kineosporia sp. NBRC 101731 TaxID=3032199 RepID=UPI0024A16E01|nr:flagellar biosynthesis protein FlgB [Kineosporia sp. NBRC 101731]GLY27020.1 hypothetical protein Kisp02_03850 [Kineosporia sp. NBRC 101731]
MSMLDDVSINALHTALDGLSQRQQAISDDIANVNTPYYRARSVDFEGQLKQALANGDDPTQVVTPTVAYSGAAGDLTSNNVDLGEASVNSVKTEMSYELALRATGDRFSLLRAAIRSN